jgi:hypothetical protein
MSFRKTVFILALLMLIGSFSCDSGKESPNYKINSTIIKEFFPNSDKIIILSCVRCGCFIDIMNKLSFQDREYLINISFATDTSCNKINFPLQVIPQRFIDSISMDIYNIILLKKIKSGEYKMKVIETKESDNFIQIAKNYFNYWN